MSGVSVRALEETDLPAADAIFRLAFGTALGLPDPSRFAEGAEPVRSRWLADSSATFAAEVDDRLAGSAFATRLGTFATLGPLTVHPDFWDRGVGRRLWEERMPLLERWGTTHAGLFTRPEAKNIHLYGRFGFYPRFLTALTAKPVEPATEGVVEPPPVLSRAELEPVVLECRVLTDATLPGLDLERELRAVADQGIGETVLLHDDEGLAGFAVCHAGKGSEAAAGACCVKFAAARPGADAAGWFGRLLDACEALAAGLGLRRIEAGVNLARHGAYHVLLERGYRPWAYGVAMQRPNEPGYNRADVYVVDDWR